MDLSKSLRMVIAEKGIKHKDLAEALNTTSQQVSNWLRTGGIKQSSVVEICDFFGFRVDQHCSQLDHMRLIFVTRWSAPNRYTCCF